MQDPVAIRRACVLAMGFARVRFQERNDARALTRRRLAASLRPPLVSALVDFVFGVHDKSAVYEADDRRDCSVQQYWTMKGVRLPLLESIKLVCGPGPKCCPSRQCNR